MTHEQMNAAQDVQLLVPRERFQTFPVIWFQNDFFITLFIFIHLDLCPLSNKFT